MTLLIRLALVAAVAWAMVVAPQAPAASLLILNKADATLVIVDPATQAILGTIPTGEGPHEVVASTDGRLAFVSNYGGQTGGRTISVIDLAARKELRRVDVSPLTRPHGLAFADGKLYFTAENNQLVARYDPVDETQRFRGRGVDEIAGQQHLHRRLAADRAAQGDHRRRAEQADIDPRCREPRVRGCDR